MAVVPGLVGPSWPVSSVNVDAERTINLFVEQPDGGATAKNPQGALLKRPGLSPFATLPAGPVRGLFSQDGRVFGVGGREFCEILSSGNTVTYGAVEVDLYPVTFASNGTAGNQLILTSGGNLYVFDLVANTLTEVPSVNFLKPARMVVFLDDTFISLRGGTRQLYFSALLDGMSWDVTQVEEVSKFSDNVQAIGISHEVLWVFGSLHSLPYTITGDANIIAAPIDQTLVEHGVLAPFSVVQLDNTLLYVAQDAQGVGQVVRMNGYTPQIISTFGVATYLSTAERLDDIIGWSYQERNHLFYHLYVPTTLRTSPVYDVSTNGWSERAQWISTIRQWRQHVGRCHAYGFGRHLVGARNSGTVYTQSLMYQSDGLVGAA